MQIRYLRIRNFRSLRDVELQNLQNLNILVGKNSSGKSNLIEALDIFFNDFSVIGGNTAGLNEYYWFNKKTKNPIEFEITIELSKSEIEFIFLSSLLKDIKRVSKSLNTLTLKRGIKNIQGAWETLTLECSGILLIKDNKSLTPNEVDSSFGELQKGRASLVHVYPTIETLNEVLQKISAIIKQKFRLVAQIRDVKSPIAHRMTLIDSELQSSLWTLDQSVKTDEEEKYVEIEAAFARVADKQLDPAQGQVYIRRQQRRFPLHLEGGGIQSSIQLIFGLQKELNKYSIFGIEEPEAHSHPALQRRLFNELKSLSERCQLFVTTHSSVFIDRIDLRNVWIVRLNNGETIIEKASELKKIVEELGIKPSDFLFFANRILFVEGKTEEIIIPTFAEQLDINLGDVAILSVEGKTKARLNLKTWVKTTRGILPIFLLLDKDAETEIEQLKKER